MKIEQFFYEHPVFTYHEFGEWKAKQNTIKDASLHMALQYYVKAGRLLRLRRELYAVVPPNSTPDDLRVDPYLLAAKVSQDSILAYHTALELHGAAYSSFEQFTFLTKSKIAAFEIAGQWYQPVKPPTVLLKQKNISFGIETINRQGLDIKITGIERTFVDVLDRIRLAGGLEEVCRSIENIAVLDIGKVVEYCLMLQNARLAAKVGYFLEQRKGAFAVTEKQLEPLSAAKPAKPQYLLQGLDNCHLIKKWNLMIPESVLNKLWEEPNAEF
jgi:predicted transcriptional regulator of viral defense system